MAVTYRPSDKESPGTDIEARGAPTGREYKWQLKIASAWHDQPNTDDLEYTIPLGTAASEARVCWSAQSAPPDVTYSTNTPHQGGQVTASLTGAAAGSITSYQWQFQQVGSTVWGHSSAPGGTTTTITVPSAEPVGTRYRITWVRYGETEVAPNHVTVDGPMAGSGSEASPYRITDAHLNEEIDVTNYVDHTRGNSTYFIHNPTNILGLWDARITTIPPADYDTRMQSIGSDGVVDFMTQITQGNTPHELTAEVADLMGTIQIRIQDWASGTEHGVSLRLNKPVPTPPVVRYSTSMPEQGTDVSADFSSTEHIASYQWQYHNGTRWVPATDDVGNDTRTLSIPLDANVGLRYRITWTYTTGTTVEHASSVTVIVRTPIFRGYSDDMPSPGDSVTAKFDVTQGITGYQWQYLNNGTWTNSGLAGSTAQTIQLLDSTHSGSQYRIRWTFGGVTHTETTYFIVTEPPAATVTYSTTEPAPGTSVTANFSSTARIASYQWQFLSGGTTWTDSSQSGNTTRTLTLGTSIAFGAQYRITWTTHSMVTHAGAAITVSPTRKQDLAPVITNVEGQAGGLVWTVSFLHSGTAPLPSEYVLESSTSTDFVAPKSATSTALQDITSPITFTLSTLGTQGRYFRLRHRYASGFAQNSPVYDAQSGDVEFLRYGADVVLPNADVTAIFTHPQGIARYQWQSRRRGSNNPNWFDVTGATMATLTLTPAAIGDTTQFRIKWTVGTQEFTASTHASLAQGATFTRYSAPTILSGQVATTNAYQGETITAEFQYSARITAYQWEFYNTNTSAWEDSTREGNSTATITMSNSQAIGTRYRISWTDPIGDRHATNEITIASQPLQTLTFSSYDNTSPHPGETITARFTGSSTGYVLHWFKGTHANPVKSTQVGRATRTVTTRRNDAVGTNYFIIAEKDRVAFSTPLVTLVAVPAPTNWTTAPTITSAVGTIAGVTGGQQISLTVNFTHTGTGNAPNRYRLESRTATSGGSLRSVTRTTTSSPITTSSWYRYLRLIPLFPDGTEGTPSSVFDVAGGAPTFNQYSSTAPDAGDTVTAFFRGSTRNVDFQWQRLSGSSWVNESTRPGNRTTAISTSRFFAPETYRITWFVNGIRFFAPTSVTVT